MEYKRNNREEIIEELNVDPERGLTAQQVEEHREKYGSNEFAEEKQTSLFTKILNQFKEVMNLILLFAGFLSLYISFSEPGHGFSEPIVIFVIIFINMAVTIYQEGKAEDALEALKSMSSPEARVIRDGKEQKINADELVCGDILLLEAGEGIAADARLLEANNLQTEESSLTGESVPVDKDANADVEEGAPIGDVEHTVFSGTSVTNGNAKAVVVAVGMDSEMGHIAGLLGETKEQKTPLQQRIDGLAKRLAILAFISAAIIFVVNYLNTDMSFLDNLMLAVSLAIAAVPETLPVIVTLTLAYGVQNMAERSAIIRNMPAVETLGSASVIASDKTGTLTQNRMTIKQIWSPAHDPKSETDEFNEEEEWMLKMMALASNVKANKDNGELKIEGNPTEAAIVYLLEKKGWSKEELEKKFPRVQEFPFDSTTKRMTTVHEYNGRYIAISKGAFERLKDTSVKPENMTHDAEEIHDQFAHDALRVLAVASKELDTLPNGELDRDKLEADMVFAGIVGMIDPPREESKQAVEEAKQAGIRPIMITGDHAATATAIAKQIGIANEETKTITGSELQKLSDEELNQNIEDYAVYARVSPEDKIRIVKAWQDRDEVVAMTGDGVNDAPSLNAADVGTAMGQAGTEVAKNASDMILTDDNFATIVQAVEEGRRVYNNIRKTIYFLLSANVAEVLLMLIIAILGWGVPLMPIHLLFINVIADGIPGFGLSREQADADIMKQAPIDRNESVFARGGYRIIGVGATTLLVISLIAFYLGANVQLDSAIEPSIEVAQTMTFLTLAWASTLNIFVVRSKQSIFKIGFMSNPVVFWTALFSVVLTGLVAAVPFLADIFMLAELGATHWIITALMSLSIIATVEIDKNFIRGRDK